MLCSSTLPPPALPPPGTRRRLSSLAQRRGATRFEGGRTIEPIAQRKVGMQLSCRVVFDLQPEEGFGTQPDPKPADLTLCSNVATCTTSHHFDDHLPFHPALGRPVGLIKNKCRIKRSPKICAKLASRTFSKRRCRESRERQDGASHVAPRLHRDTSLIRKHLPLGPYCRNMPMAIWWP